MNWVWHFIRYKTTNVSNDLSMVRCIFNVLKMLLAKYLNIYESTNFARFSKTLAWMYDVNASFSCKSDVYSSIFYVLKTLLTKDLNIYESTNFDLFNKKLAWMYDAKASFSCKTNVYSKYTRSIRLKFWIYWCRFTNIYIFLCIELSTLFLQGLRGEAV